MFSDVIQLELFDCAIYTYFFCLQALIILMFFDFIFYLELTERDLKQRLRKMTIYTGGKPIGGIEENYPLLL